MGGGGGGAGLLDENLSWIEHIKYKQNKLVKNVGLLDKTKHYLWTRDPYYLYIIPSYIPTLITEI